MLDDIRRDKIRKLERFRHEGVEPFPSGPFAKTDISRVIVQPVGDAASIAGRIMLMREMGNITFLHVQDESGRMQVVLNKRELPDDYKLWTKNLDLGDFIGVTGTRFDTQKGERSVMASAVTLLAKSIRPLPDKYRGLEDEEDRLRKRYLDILFNPEIKDLVYKRDRFWSAVRLFMKEKGFVEVETPVLEVTAGGADARPFVTHHNALDMDVYLRISMGELWQKRLMVAGLEKTFEIGRQFRNEGMDAEHLQDYTQMEFYWAYADYEKGMELVTELFRSVAQQAFDTQRFSIHGFDIDLAKPWERYDYAETIRSMTGVDIAKATVRQIEKKLKELKIDYDKKGFNITRAIDNLWKYCRKRIAGPGFLVNEPLVVSPLAKKRKDDPDVVERFHVIIAGSELGNGYSELNDPIDQAERFFEQQKLREAGDDEAQMFDHDFVEALEYGMPPTCGFGMSERVFSFFMDKTGRECQIFPLMKPKDTTVFTEVVTAKFDVPDPTITTTTTGELGIDYATAQKLVDQYVTTDTTKKHLLESEAIMRALARHSDQDEEQWGIIGLLHDIDWDLSKDDTMQHCAKMVGILKEAGATDFLIETIQSHGYGNEKCGAPTGKQRSGNLQHLLAASETLTGLVVAAALMQPDKKLASVKLSSLKKKFKDRRFAANCDREIILECEQAGIPIDQFLEIGLAALQGIAPKLGL